MYKTLTYSTDH